jgi:hypothetical protein
MNNFLALTPWDLELVKLAVNNQVINYCYLVKIG